MKRRIIAFVTAVLFVFLIGCKKQEKVDEQLIKYSRQSTEYFDTVIQIIGYAETEEEFLASTNQLMDLYEEYNKLFDIYNSYEGVNNIKTINSKAGSQPVSVDQKLIDFLEYCIDAYTLTNGKTNIAMGSVLLLWHDCRDNASYDPFNATVPDKQTLIEQSKYTDIKSVVIDKNERTVFLNNPKVRLDVGAVAKGYATEMVAQLAEKMGLNNMAINAGGNIRTIGTKLDGTSWSVGIQNPDLNADVSYVCKVNVDSCSLVTSGSYQRFFTVDGKIYHHIIDPETLYPSEYFTSVSVICKDSGMGDYLSTALFTMSFEDGQKLVETLDGVEALWIFEDGEMKQSNGFSSFLCD